MNIKNIEQESCTLDIKDLDASENSFLKLIDTIPDAIVIVNQKGEIKHINSQTKKMFGYSSEELIGKTVEILMPERFSKKHVQHRTEYTTNPKRRSMGSGFDLFGKHKYGNEFPIDIMLAPIETEKERLTISVIRDITDRKEKEEEAKKRARQLEDLVSALAHDLKTPLFAAKSTLNHLLDGHFGQLSKEQKEIHTLLIQNNETSLRLVTSLLSVFKYESKSYKLLLELVEIIELINKAICTVKTMIDEKNIRLKISDTSFKFICDPLELERVIVNLLTNSIKHTPQRGLIEIKTLKNEDGKVTISIEDNGNGISSDDLPNIFERFWQSRKSSSTSCGTGLGLYLCRQIIEAHGGKISAKSEIGKGTKITFEIPELS